MHHTMISQCRLSAAATRTSSAFHTHGASVCLLWLLQKRNKGWTNGPFAPGTVQLVEQNKKLQNEKYVQYHIFKYAKC
jgi:hypothetical protein